MKNPFRVEVEWIDSGAARSEGWENREDIVKALNVSKAVISVGLLMHEDEHQIVLALTGDPDTDTYFSAFVIFKPCIKRVTVLRARQDLEPDSSGMYFPGGV